MTRHDILWFIFGDLNSLKRCAGLSAIVAAAYAYGRFANDTAFPRLCFLVGTVLAIASLIGRSSDSGSLLEKIGALILIGYVGHAVLTFAFAFDGVVDSLIWLTPLLIGGVILPFRGSGLAGWGCWLIAFCGVTAATFNVYHIYSGMGFIGMWLA